MKKHPVDDLFRKKLSTIERQPSAVAWNRILIDTGKQSNKLGSWIWYAAASVALGLLAGYLVWQNQNPLTPKFADVHRTAPLKPAEIKTETIIATTTDLAEPIEPRHTNRISDVPEVAALRTKNTPKPSDVDTPESNPLPVENTNPIAVSVEIPLEDSPEKVVSQNTVGEISPITKSDTRHTDRVIIVNVTPEIDSIEKPKESRFTRVFRQLKNARAGERINWEEVGFDPRTVIARVDNKRKQ